MQDGGVGGSDADRLMLWHWQLSDRAITRLKTVFLQQGVGNPPLSHINMAYSLLRDALLILAPNLCTKCNPQTSGFLANVQRNVIDEWKVCQFIRPHTCTCLPPFCKRIQLASYGNPRHTVTPEIRGVDCQGSRLSGPGLTSLGCSERTPSSVHRWKPKSRLPCSLAAREVAACPVAFVPCYSVGRGGGVAAYSEEGG